MLAGMTRKWPLNRLIRSIRVQTLSLAALHTEGTEDGDDEIDYFLNCFLFHFLLMINVECLIFPQITQIFFTVRLDVYKTVACNESICANQ